MFRISERVRDEVERNRGRFGKSVKFVVVCGERFVKVVKVFVLIELW